jgi:hypothetical protein
VLPPAAPLQLKCFCDKHYSPTVGCKTPDANDLPLPFPCPADHIFEPSRFEDGSYAEAGMPIPFRVYSFLDNPDCPPAVKVHCRGLSVCLFVCGSSY